jgi:hypothetical protein
MIDAVKDVWQTLRRMNYRTLATQTIQLGGCCCVVDLAAAAVAVEVLARGAFRSCGRSIQIIELHACPMHALPAAGLIITSALMMWKTLMLVTRSESPVSHPARPMRAWERPPSPACMHVQHGTLRPQHMCPCMRVQVVVVLSGSMEPGFQRGDILFLNLGFSPIRTGEIVVFNIDGRDIPIVHRVIKVHEKPGSDDADMLTKGGEDKYEEGGEQKPKGAGLGMRDWMRMNIYERLLTASMCLSPVSLCCLLFPPSSLSRPQTTTTWMTLGSTPGGKAG